MFEYNVCGFIILEFYCDGFSVNCGYMNVLDSVIIECVEIFKGLVFSFYGCGDFGGMVNLVIKKFQVECFVCLYVSVGSWDCYCLILDLNMLLDEEGDLFYWMNLVVEDSKGFCDYVDGQCLLVVLLFSW